MIQKIKDYAVLILIGVVLILLLTNISTCNSKKNSEELASQFDKSIAALNDTLKKTVNKEGDSVWQQKTVSIALDAFVNSETFKSLDKDKQKWFAELQKTKGLLAAAEATIQYQRTFIDSLTYKGSSAVASETDSTVCFYKGDSLVFNNPSKDTTFTYTSKINFNKDKVEHTLQAKFNLDLQVTHKKDKKGNYLIEYKASDNRVTITNGKSYMIPQIELTKFQKFNMKYGVWVYPSIAFTGGFYLGTRFR